MYSRELISNLKEIYHSGDRVRLNSDMDDVNPVFAGTEGTIESVDDIGNIHVKWDNGRSLALIYGEDSFTKI